MGLRLGFYALIAIVGLLGTAGLGLFNQGRHTTSTSALAAPLEGKDCQPWWNCGNNGGNNDGGNNGGNNDGGNNGGNNDGGNNDGGNNGGNNDGGNNGGDGGGDNGNGNGGGGGDNGNGNGNGNDSAGVAASGSGDCVQAGHDATITSIDGRIAVHVFPSMSRNVRISIVTPVDPTTVPANPGQKVDALLFQVRADDCNGGAISPLPVEVNLGVHYSDVDVTGLTESKFVIGHLDSVDNTWKQELKQAADPNANFVSATIVNTGYFVVYQTP
jgi:hypothetical protein